MGPEQKILNHILEYLVLRRVPHVHIRNTGSIIKRNGKIYWGKPRISQLGAPDIIACINGWPVAIEVKSKTGRLSHSQEIFLTHWESERGVAVVVNDLEQVMELDAKLKVTNPGQGLRAAGLWRKGS